VSAPVPAVDQARSARVVNACGTQPVFCSVFREINLNDIAISAFNRM
jgi:hypothetical protein